MAKTLEFSYLDYFLLSKDYSISKSLLTAKVELGMIKFVLCLEAASEVFERFGESATRDVSVSSLPIR